MGYISKEGPDDPVDVLFSARCFGVAIGHLLKNREGICVELLKDENEKGGKFVIFRDGKEIKIEGANSFAQLGMPELKNGQMLWIHEIDET
jgi:hypothetical protein